MTPPTEKPFEPTPEQVEEVAKKMYCSLFPEPNCWPNIVNSTYWKEAARWHLAELSTLRSQLDALKAEVVIKNDAIKRTLKYLRSPEDESAEMIERVLDGALKPAEMEAGR